MQRNDENYSVKSVCLGHICQRAGQIFMARQYWALQTLEVFGRLLQLPWSCQWGALALTQVAEVTTTAEVAVPHVTQ
jgi:hypothetical protein